MAIADNDDLKKSSNWKILLPHISPLDAMRKLDERVGQGTLARLLAGQVAFQGEVIAVEDIHGGARVVDSAPSRLDFARSSRNRLP